MVRTIETGIVRLWRCGWFGAATCLLLAACSSAPPQLAVPPDGWTYGPHLVELQLSAAETLNIDSGQPHAMSLGVFQLSDPAAFSNLAANSAGAEKLLDQGMDSDPSVVGFDRIVLQPGDKHTIYLNRAANAQYLGFVAGYYKLVPAQDVAVFNIPIVPKPVGWVTKGMEVVGLEGDDTDGMPAPVTLSIGLGSEQVALFKSLTDGSARVVASPKGGGKGNSSSGGSGSKGGKLPSLPSVPKLPSKPSSGGSGGGGG